MSNIGVHQNHCCKIHGCKYGEKDCPVVQGTITQAYLCEDCPELNDQVQNVEMSLKELKLNLELKNAALIHKVEEMEKILIDIKKILQ